MHIFGVKRKNFNQTKNQKTIAVTAQVNVDIVDGVW